MHNQVLDVIVAVGMTFGIFGNVNVIAAIWRKKMLRTKGAMFVLVLAITHLTCNLSEVIGIIFQLRFSRMSKKKCFEYNVVYCFAVLFQSALFFSIALDLCFSIVVPLKHMIWKKFKYVSIMCTFPLLFATVNTVTGFVFIPDEETPYCVFILTTDHRIYQAVSNSLIVLNTITLLIVIASVMCAVRKTENMRASRHSNGSRTNSLREEKHKFFRSTFFLLIIYIVSWWLTVILFRLVMELEDNATKAVGLIPYLIIIAMPNFCQTYYVTCIRSPRFNRAYKEQLNWISCGLFFPRIFDKPPTKCIENGCKTATNSAQQHIQQERTTNSAAGPKPTEFAVQVSV